VVQENLLPEFCFLCSEKKSGTTVVMKTSAIFLLSLFCLSGCLTSASKINAVHIGMTKAEVLAAMGEPISVTADKTGEYLNYSLAEGQTSFDAPRTPYEIKLVNGRVESYGRAGAPSSGTHPTYVPPPVIIPPAR
jgi:hypothetical protein